MSEIIIQTDEIKKTFVMGTNKVHALKGINLRIHQNEFVALMGQSGSGKSTLMNILGCLDSPTSGTYILDDADVSTLNESQLATVRNQRIGFVFQTFNLMPRMTTLENVMLPLLYSDVPQKKRKEMAIGKLELVGLRDRLDHKPNELSGGQRQRVAIARALVNNPSIILADEPTGNLDTRTSIEIMSIFEEIHTAGNTIVIVTHEPDISMHASRIITLRDGLIMTDVLNATPISAKERLLTEG